MFEGVPEIYIVEQAPTMNTPLLTRTRSLQSTMARRNRFESTTLGVTTG